MPQDHVDDGSAAPEAAAGGGAAGAGRRRAITYRVAPSNYYTLSNAEKSEKLAAFSALLRSVEKHVRIVMSKSPAVLGPAHGGRRYVRGEVYVTSQQDLGEQLARSDMRVARLRSPFELEAASEELLHVTMADGRLARGYTLHNMSRSITAGWINALASICPVVGIDIRPLKPAAAKRMMSVHANMLLQRPGRRHGEEAAEAAVVRDAIENEQDVLMDCGVAAVVHGSTARELAANCKEFERQAGWRQIRVAAIMGRQAATVSGAWGHRFLLPSAACSVWYPFESSDLIEVDAGGGVVLGTNELTGAPVVYDHQLRTNLNCTLVGESGRGKSTMMKTYVDNFLRMVEQTHGGDTRVMLAIIDPHGEYQGLAGRFGARWVDLGEREPLGNPLRFYTRPDAAVAIMAEAAGMPPKERSLATVGAAGCSTIAELVGKLHADKSPNRDDSVSAAGYLRQFSEGDLASLFSEREGEGSQDTDRVVYGLRKAAKSKMDAMVISTALAKAWRDMRDAPRSVPKLLVVDEAWFVLSMEESAQIVQDVAKSGRKENVQLLFTTQDMSDLLGNPHGQSILANSATVAAFRLNAAMTEILRGAVNLSDAEVSRVQELGRGHMLLRADKHRIWCGIEPTDEQLQAFGTSAERMGAGQ